MATPAYTYLRWEQSNQNVLRVVPQWPGNMHLFKFSHDLFVRNLNTSIEEKARYYMECTVGSVLRVDPTPEITPHTLPQEDRTPIAPGNEC